MNQTNSSKSDTHVNVVLEKQRENSVDINEFGAVSFS